MLLILLCLFHCLSTINARAGVDLSVSTSIDTWKCLKENYSIDYTIIRLYRSIGDIDSNSANSIHSASSVGITDIGGYMFPCLSTSPYSKNNNITCLTAEQQVLTTLKYLEENNIRINRDNEELTMDNKSTYINRIWLDIEDEVPSKYYDEDPSVNQQFIDDIVTTLEKFHVPVGIYTTLTYWNNIMDNIEGYSKYPLWYPRYDGVDSMDFFSPFAGWTAAQIKQTAGDSGYCNISQVDSDYMLD